MAPRRPRAPSPRARPPREGRAAPRARAGGRRPAPASRAADETVAAGLVPHLPAGRLDLPTQPVRLGEVALLTRLLPQPRELTNLIRSLRLSGCQAEDPERPPQQVEVPHPA